MTVDVITKLAGKDNTAIVIGESASAINGCSDDYDASISIGRCSRDFGGNTVIVGSGAQARENSVAVGNRAGRGVDECSNGKGVMIGYAAYTLYGVAIGESSRGDYGGVAIGRNARTNGGVRIGNTAGIGGAGLKQEISIRSDGGDNEFRIDGFCSKDQAGLTLVIGGCSVHLTREQAMNLFRSVL